MEVTREHVEAILRLTPLTGEERAEVLALDYPADLDAVMNVMQSFGVTRDWLVSYFGGSP